MTYTAVLFIVAGVGVLMVFCVRAIVTLLLTDEPRPYGMADSRPERLRLEDDEDRAWARLRNLQSRVDADMHRRRA